MPRFYIPLESFSVNCHYWRNVLRGSGKGRRIKEFIYATTHLSVKQDEKLVSQSWKEKNSSLIVFDNLTLVKKQFLFPEYYISYINSRCTHQLTVRCTPSTMHLKNTSTRYALPAYQQPLTDVVPEEMRTITTLGADSKKKGTNQQFCNVRTHKNCISNSEGKYDQKNIKRTFNSCSYQFSLPL